MPGQSSTGGSGSGAGALSPAPPNRLTWALSRSLAAALAWRTMDSAAWNTWARFGQRESKAPAQARFSTWRSEEHTSELQSLMRISYAVFCLKKQKKNLANYIHTLLLK